MNDERPASPPGRPAFSKHRLEGLTDGIYAVAMTLLAIELKFPEAAHIVDDATLLAQLAHLLPRFISWALSFAILGIFWFSQQKAFHYARSIDARLIVINLVTLAFITLLPFCTMLIGAYANVFSAHVAYALNMCVLALLCIRQIRYIASRDELSHNGLTPDIVRGVAIRCWGLVACAALAVALACFAPRYASMAFMAMAVITPLSRRFERPAAAVPAAPSAS